MFIYSDQSRVHCLLVLPVVMYALVKFVDDGVTAVVDVNDIKKFDASEIIANKKYKIRYTDGHYYKGFVICVGDSEDEVHNKVNKRRIKIPSQAVQLDTDTATDEDELEQSTSVKNKGNTDKNRNILSAVENYEDIITNKTVNVLTPNDKEKNSLKLENAELKKNQARLQRRIEELEILNEQLQHVVIDKFKELTLLSNHHEEKEKNPPAIGARIDGNIHLGRDIYIPCHIYDTAASRKKDSVFIKELAVAVFGEATLKKSSVTGSASNRIKGAEAKPALNATKLMAIHDIVEYRLLERGETREYTRKICNSINAKIAEKIYDLIRPPRSKKTDHADADIDADVDVGVDDVDY